MNEEYLNLERDKLTMMRLLIEGAANLYEGDAQRLYCLGLEKDDLAAAMAMDTVGVALTELLDVIRDLQMENMRQRALPVA